MTTLKVTEYIPAYNYMEEIYVLYDFTNHRYRVDNGKWKRMTSDYELRIKEQYKVNWKWGNNMSRLTIEQRKNVPAKQQKRVIQKLLNDTEIINKLTTSEVYLLQEVINILDKQAKQQVKDLQFKLNMSEWETNVKKKYSNKDYYDISDVV